VALFVTFSAEGVEHRAQDASAKPRGAGRWLASVLVGSNGNSIARDAEVTHLVPTAVTCSRTQGVVRGIEVDLYHLRSTAVELKAMTYGAIITSITAPDRNGARENVVLGHAATELYANNRAYLGAIVGRHANRIAGAKFTLDGRTYHVDVNEGVNHLHGGHRGFDQQMWTARASQDRGSASVSFWYLSPDGDAGYPGALGIRVTYTLTDSGSIILNYEARASAPTVVNLTQHTYFNLSGNSGEDARGHELVIHAERFTPVGPGLVPTGQLASVAGTPFDFRGAARIGDRLVSGHEQLAAAGGFDHNWALASASREGAVPAARLHHPRSGRTLAVATTEPGLQFYDGRALGQTRTDASSAFPPSAGLCLETQHYPDAPNQPDFPSTVVRPGKPYRSTTIWQLSVD